MNSQNRMNAGAEYVLYRIWATLQDGEGIHAESLLACVGALAGYACQAAAGRADGDGSAQALNRALVASPLSVWSLVRRGVQKLGKPLPDIDAITDAPAVSRVAEEHRPRLPAIIYLSQLWPQILPIARRFCRKPSQLPVLFGIALQRALEHTAESLNPTLGASIAMECAVAMSRVAPLPGELLDVNPKRVRTGASRTAAPRKWPGRASSRSIASAPRLSGFSARLPSMKIVATVASLAIIAIGSRAMLSKDGAGAVEPARVVGTLKVPAFSSRALRSAAFQPAAFRAETPSTEQPVEETLAAPEAPPVLDEQPPAAEPELQMPTVPEPSTHEGIISEDGMNA